MSLKEKENMPNLDTSKYKNRVYSSNERKYKCGECIGSGGNGLVFMAEIVDGETFKEYSEVVIKILHETEDSKVDAKDIEKRKERFKREIDKLTDLKSEVIGIVTILDSCNDGDDEVWYVMPKYERYKYGSLKELFIDMAKLAEIIEQLHENKVVHRDIKPANILKNSGNIILSDFGLSKSDHEIENLTGTFERVGPYVSSPPELREPFAMSHEEYMKSDVYLFAKTIWILLAKKFSQGFYGEYSRRKQHICLNKPNGVITLEPINTLLEGATKDNYIDRIGIDECLRLLNDQIMIIDNQDKELINKYTALERIKSTIVKADSIIYLFKTKDSIRDLMNSICKGARLQITYENNMKSKEYSFIRVKEVDEKFEVQIAPSWSKNDINRILIDVVKAEVMDDKTFIYTKKHQTENGSEQHEKTGNIDEAIMNTKERLLLNSDFVIEIN